MKKYLIIIGLIIICFDFNVYAKDSVYTMTKYEEGAYDYILMNKKDYVVAGTFLKETINLDDVEYGDVQVMLVKYNKNNDILWKYSYGSTISDELYALNYHYNDSLEEDGYVLTVNKTATIEEYDYINRPYFVIVDNSGKNVGEVDTFLEVGSMVRKVITTSDQDGNINGYIVIGENNGKSFIAKYDLSLNLLFNKPINMDGYTDTSIREIKEYKDSFIGIVYNNDLQYRLVKFDEEGNLLKVIKEDFEEKDTPHVFVNKDNYIVYGLTSEVEINKKSATSYYLINYNDLDEVVWDTIGDVSVNKEKTLKLVNGNKGLTIMYQHGSDSLEVVKIKSDGTIGEKIKKIKNSYYNIYDYVVKKNTIYFVGQIICPEDDNCDYKTSSLLLVSDETKVIEVKDDDSNNIFIVIGILCVVGYLTIFYIKKKRN